MAETGPIQKKLSVTDVPAVVVSKSKAAIQETLSSISERFTGQTRGRTVGQSTPLNSRGAEAKTDQLVRNPANFRSLSTPPSSASNAPHAGRELSAVKRAKSLNVTPDLMKQIKSSNELLQKYKSTNKPLPRPQSAPLPSTTYQNAEKASKEAPPIPPKPTLERTRSPSAPLSPSTAAPTPKLERSQSEPTSPPIPPKPMIKPAYDKNLSEVEINKLEEKRLNTLNLVCNELYTSGATFNKDISAVAAQFTALDTKLREKGKRDPVLSNFAQSLNQLKEVDHLILAEFERINKMPPDKKQEEFGKLFQSPNYTFYMQAHGRFLLLLNEIKPEQMSKYSSQIKPLSDPALKERQIDPSILQLRCQKLPLLEEEMIKLTKPGAEIPVNYSKSHVLRINEQRRATDLLKPFAEFYSESQRISTSNEAKQVLAKLDEIGKKSPNKRTAELVNFFRSNEFNAHIDSLSKVYENPDTSEELKGSIKSYFQATHAIIKGVGFGETIKADLPSSFETLKKALE